MLNRLNQREREHLARIKALPCALCEAAAPSEAHHIIQHRQYLAIPLCADCHRGGFNGIHGQRRLWSVKKVNEWDLLNETIKRITA